MYKVDIYIVVDRSCGYRNVVCNAKDDKLKYNDSYEERGNNKRNC